RPDRRPARGGEDRRGRVALALRRAGGLSMGRSLTTRRVRTRWARGVSLLEALVALSIAVAGLAVALTAVAQSARASEAVERSRREVALAKALVEEAFLGLMSEEQKAESTASADIWRGVDERGLGWEVTITSSLMGA